MPSNIDRRLRALETRKDRGSMLPVFLLVDCAKGESKEGMLARHLEAHPQDADKERFVVILNSQPQEIAA